MSPMTKTKARLLRTIQSGLALLIVTCVATIAALIAYGLPSHAFAADTPVTLSIKVLKEQRTNNADGTTSVDLVPAIKAIPGDRLVYVLTYVNTSKAPVADLVVDYPLPAGIAYRAGAEGSLPPQVSADGVHYGPPGASADAPLKTLRWQVPGSVAPGAHGEISFKATLN